MEIDLFVHLAEIAGVFVGFGALISQRAARPSDAHDVVYLRGVLALGIWVVVAALLPVVVSRYDVDEAVIWRPSAVVALVAWAGFLAAFGLSGESRSINRSPERLDRLFPLVGVPLHLLIGGSLVLVVAGSPAGSADALYVTALATALVFAGYALLALVMSRRREPGVATGPDDSAVDGGAWP